MSCTRYVAGERKKTAESREEAAAAAAAAAGEKKKIEHEDMPRQERYESRAKNSDTKSKNQARKSGNCVAHRNALALYCGA